MQRFLSAILASVAVLAAIACASCSPEPPSTPSAQAPPGGHVVVSISDPATCAAPDGPYAHIFITIAGVAAGPNPSVSEGAAGFVDLAPLLRERPVQVDLLGKTDERCRLAMLGHGIAPAGDYRMLRVSLLGAAGDFSSIAGENRCRGAAKPTANCVVTRNGAVLPLDLPSGDSFDIGPGAIPGRQFTISPSGTTQVNISLDGCDSVVSRVESEKPGSYSFVPAARAGVLDRASTISGRVIDGATGEAIEGRAIIALEQRGEGGIDRIVMAATPDDDGNFTLCPVPDGEYDLAVVAVSSERVAYVPALLLGVPAGVATGDIPLVRSGTVSAEPATVVGQVSLLAGKRRGFGQVRVSALARAGSGARALTFTIPLPHSPAGTLMVAGPSAIPYSFTLPAASPRIGVFSASGTHFLPSAAPPAFTVEAQGCRSTKTTPSPVRVTPGGTASAPILTISTCDAA